MFFNYNIKSNLFLSYYEMISDKNRNQFFYDALQSCAKDKVVLDLGTGTGILSHYALTAGAKFVYAVDLSKEATTAANSVLSNSFDRSRFKVINGNFWNESCYSHIDKQIDVVVSETVGIGLFDQGMLSTWQLLKQFIKNENLISIPEQLSVDLWFFENPNDITFCDLAPESSITDDDVIDARYFASLSKVDALLESKGKVPNLLKTKPALIKGSPTKIIENVIRYSYDLLPAFNNDEHSAFKIVPKVSTELFVDSPSIIVLVHKLSFRDNTLYLMDAKKMPWRYCPSFIVGKTGNFTLSFDYAHRDSFLDTGWNLKFNS